ncbi:DNA-3-methyladenine glycosylase I [Teredinibacter turnerae]|uniref:DNA-3-methyladenine glycosylase I n=1 Tax=Teredinibacter turnerae TaxID=2426 RepID=UPI00037099E5|nr:DNA-3-methyladenine glycosylase I [Teredinibacter turnerae]
MIEFATLYETAILHKGGEASVKALLPRCKTPAQLRAQSDAFYLDTMSLRIFRAGLKHELVDNKWPAFQQAYHGFDPFFCAMLSDEDIEQLMANRGLIRHLGKIKSVRENAQWLREIASEYGGFGQWLADWPAETLVELWAAMKKHGRQLGGMSGPYFLRMVGRDTFLLTQDVCAVLVAQGIVTKTPSSKAELKAVQHAFNVWQEESGRPFCEISRIVAMTVLG